MIQIGALQAQRAFLPLKPDKTSFMQFPCALSAGRGGATHDKHDEILSLLGAGHACILHRRERNLNGIPT
jgi:hypothetical protein